ncbi:hypothetical protein B0T17DRAFT_620561 [Bombardia bombarda]|uniref:Uncharacterized protein n=1 Tax=Bombardia bombarda TaxID=252184 RepID=A0AA39T271_9PEZI|nr:hypothetical protein B0T17DRAFT_620561 [Bombardia bombarda]
MSSTESSASEDQQFAFSAENTPATENPPSHGAMSALGLHSSTARDGLLFGKEVSSRSQCAKDIAEPDDPPQVISRSKPIAIELPTVRKRPAEPALFLADEPLSARGDIQGAYFPHHEDPSRRLRRTHPFHLDATKARHNSLSKAAESAQSSTSTPTDNTQSAATMSTSTHFSFGSSASTITPVSHIPVSSYLPIGVHNTAALPMGKYYPSNYENRSNNTSQSRLRARGGKAASSPSGKSDTQVSKCRREHSSHSRSSSEVKRRLQQYQRDMVAQATVAASAIIEKSAADESGRSAAALTPGFSLKNIQLGGTLIKGLKPRSPRLAPLGSPGPVTPMELEGGGDSYLTLGRPMTGPDAEHQLAEVSRALQSEEARRLRDDSRSPSGMRTTSF